MSGTGVNGTSSTASSGGYTYADPASTEGSVGAGYGLKPLTMSCAAGR